MKNNYNNENNFIIINKITSFARQLSWLLINLFRIQISRVI